LAVLIGPIVIFLRLHTYTGMASAVSLKKDNFIIENEFAVIPVTLTAI
jgi:hypothetical protein